MKRTRRVRKYPNLRKIRNIKTAVISVMLLLWRTPFHDVEILWCAVFFIFVPLLLFTGWEGRMGCLLILINSGEWESIP
jgi:hypothetical protein